MRRRGSGCVPFRALGLRKPTLKARPRHTRRVCRANSVVSAANEVLAESIALFRNTFETRLSTYISFTKRKIARFFVKINENTIFLRGELRARCKLREELRSMYGTCRILSPYEMEKSIPLHYRNYTLQIDKVHYPLHITNYSLENTH